jgi:voltage-gated potassium channel
VNRRDPRSELFARLVPASLLLASMVLIGTLGYHALGSGDWTWGQCLYMTVITLSTVGFGELPRMDVVPGAHALTIGLIIFGSGTLVYFVSMITAVVLEGDLKDVLRRNRMLNAIDRMKEHIIVCGLGITGRHIVEELVVTQTPFVVIDHDEIRVKHVMDELGREFPYVIGDTTQDMVLEEAGVRRAAGLVAALQDDRDNVFVTLSARQLNEKLRIIAKADDRTNADKLKRAGASGVVMPSFIGGLRIASELIRPNVVQFLDEMLRERQSHYRIEEVYVPAGSALAGKSLEDGNVRKYADVLVLSVRQPDSGAYQHNPPPATMVQAGMHLVVLARTEEVVRLRQVLGPAPTA